MKRSYLKRGNSQLAKGKPLSSNSSLKRGGSIKSKPVTQEAKDAKIKQREKDIEFYTGIWNKREHRCQECGKWLGSELSIAYMDHVIEKSTHPELRYEESNIFICCIEDHARKTNGFPGPVHREAIRIAKQKFNI